MNQTKIVIPECGGDAGLSFIKMILEYDPNLRDNLIGLDADLSTNLASPYLPTIEYVPHVRNRRDVRKQVVCAIAGHLEDILNKDFDFLIAPTSEFMALGVLDAVDKVADDPESKFLSRNSRKIHYVSFDKKKLGACPFGIDTFNEWSPRTTLGKPRYGIGSSGVYNFPNGPLQGTISENFPGNYVFQELMGGTELVLDYVHGFTICREVYKLKGGADVVMKVIPTPDKVREIALQVASYLKGDVFNIQLNVNRQEQYKVFDLGARLSGASEVCLKVSKNLTEVLMAKATNSFMDLEEVKSSSNVIRRKLEFV